MKVERYTFRKGYLRKILTSVSMIVVFSMLLGYWASAKGHITFEMIDTMDYKDLFYTFYPFITALICLGLWVYILLLQFEEACAPINIYRPYFNYLNNLKGHKYSPWNQSE